MNEQIHKRRWELGSSDELKHRFIMDLATLEAQNRTVMYYHVLKTSPKWF